MPIPPGASPLAPLMRLPQCGWPGTREQMSKAAQSLQMFPPSRPGDAGENEHGRSANTPPCQPTWEGSPPIHQDQRRCHWLNRSGADVACICQAAARILVFPRSCLELMTILHTNIPPWGEGTIHLSSSVYRIRLESTRSYCRHTLSLGIITLSLFNLNPPPPPPSAFLGGC
ncbi:hypothetical protein CGRA01v4_10670 [Colletotrichum graminicola]|nr:hypothetical protein CGRA01v4_10670 [Colletotrichum graminicola]